MTHLVRLVALLAALIGYAVPLHAAGTINLSLSQQFDTQGQPLSGCKLYFYQAGTTTPQSAYADADLSIALPNPLECDASGRIGQFFLADGNIKIRLADKNGVTVLAADNILVIGPSSGGGGGGSVDATTIAATGDLKVRYGTGALSGWVRANGRTVGSATSGATERANADTQTLWEYLCTTDTALRATISGGYSGNCATDYAANKTIQLPDYRGYALAGLGDMGNTATTGLTSTYFGTDPTVLGASASAQSITFAQENLPSLNFTVTIPAGQGSHSHGYSRTNEQNLHGGSVGDVNSGAFGTQTDLATLPQMTGTAASGGSDTPFSIVGRFKLATIYIKL